MGEVVAFGDNVECIASNASSSTFFFMDKENNATGGGGGGSDGGDDGDGGNGGDGGDGGGVVASPGLRVVPAEPGLGTWRTWGVLHATKLRAVPSDLPLVESAQLGVNPPTALRMLDDFVRLTPCQDDEAGTEDGDVDVTAVTAVTDVTFAVAATVALNAPTSAVGRAAIQICKHRGVPVVALLRPRHTREAFEADERELSDLGAVVVFADDGKSHRSADAREGLRLLPPVKLALNGVGGASSATLASMLAKDGVVVTYGGMARQPANVPTGALIFKNISARGFWLTRWLADEKKKTAKSAATAEAANDRTSASIPRTPRRIREMTDELFGLVREGKLRMPAREVGLDDVVTALAEPAKVGGRKVLIRLTSGGKDS